jgi:hypothetical protein
MNFTIETRIDVAPDENEYFGIQLLVRVIKLQSIGVKAK